MGEVRVTEILQSLYHPVQLRSKFSGGIIHPGTRRHAPLLVVLCRWAPGSRYTVCHPPRRRSRLILLNSTQNADDLSYVRIGKRVPEANLFTELLRGNLSAMPHDHENLLLLTFLTLSRSPVMETPSAFPATVHLLYRPSLISPMCGVD
jgi:hypothetical protein